LIRGRNREAAAERNAQVKNWVFCSYFFEFSCIVDILFDGVSSRATARSKDAMYGVARDACVGRVTRDAV
jgi:hypothetical protein